MNSTVARLVAIVGGLLAVVGMVTLAVWALRPGEQPAVPPGLTEVADAGSIGAIVELSHLGIVTSTNYMGHKIYLVRGTLKNVANHPVRMVDVRMRFEDYGGKAIHEETHHAFEPKQKPLEPGTEYRFEIAFENPPKTWNFRVPVTEIVRAAY